MLDTKHLKEANDKLLTGVSNVQLSQTHSLGFTMTFQKREVTHFGISESHLVEAGGID